MRWVALCKTGKHPVSTSVDPPSNFQPFLGSFFWIQCHARLEQTRVFSKVSVMPVHSGVLELGGGIRSTTSHSGIYMTFTKKEGL
jgi:hypothetical protein